MYKWGSKVEQYRVYSGTRGLKWKGSGVGTSGRGVGRQSETRKGNSLELSVFFISNIETHLQRVAVASMIVKTDSELHSTGNMTKF